MDGFGDNFVPNGETNGVAAEDPAAEFLAREQSDLAGIEDPPAIVTESGDDTVATATAASAPPPAAANTGSTDDADLFGGSAHTPERAVTPTPIIPRIEPEAIREWREEHQRTLVTKDESEEKAKDELREKAQQELTDWYKQHDQQLAKTRQANRCAEKELVADTERPVAGQEWERIAKLCDFNPKTSAKSSRDVSRMRSIILHVKQTPPCKA